LPGCGCPALSVFDAAPNATEFSKVASAPAPNATEPNPAALLALPNAVPKCPSDTAF